VTGLYSGKGSSGYKNIVTWTVGGLAGRKKELFNENNSE